jgi:hypothetical protein
MNPEIMLNNYVNCGLFKKEPSLSLLFQVDKNGMALVKFSRKESTSGYFDIMRHGIRIGN